MAIAYFDSSALVKLLVDEAGSDVAAAIWDGCDAVFASRLAYPEVCAALAGAGRRGDLGSDEMIECLHRWQQFWASIRPVELSAQVEETAFPDRCRCSWSRGVIARA